MAALCLAVELGAQPAQPVIRYFYDDLGRLVGVVDQAGQAAFFAYDQVGNLRSIVRQTAGPVMIMAFLPGGGPGGTSVILHGVGFGALPGDNLVTFNGAIATVTAASPTRLVVTVPLEATSGPISVMAPAGTGISGASFLVDPPTITAFGPQRGGVGTPVTITGTGFSATVSNNTVRFNGVSAAIISATPTQLVAAVPSGATTGPIAVTSPRGSATSQSPFTVLPSPMIAGFSPTTGPPDTEVTITGADFSEVFGENTVDFNGAFAAVAAATTTELRAIVPLDATTGPIRVTTLGGSATSADVFTVTASPPPEITGFTPSSAAVGMPVIIAGTLFGEFPEENVVAFNGVPAVVSSASSTELVVDVPDGATTGPITVTAPTGTATSGTDFVVIAPAPPTIAGFSPTSGTTTDLVTITGTGFAVVADRNTVVFDGAGTGIVFAATDTQLIVRGPPCFAGVNTGPITVTTPLGSATSPQTFTLTGVGCD
jgi:YD repeat-containing protein